MTLNRHSNTASDGLTLLELLVVVAILAVLASVAVRVTGDIESDQRYRASQETLSNVKSAILGEGNSAGGFGGAQTLGFVADVGRLPRSRVVTGVDFDYLAMTEIYSLSSPNLPPYQLWTNISGSYSFFGDSTTNINLTGLATFNAAVGDGNLRIPAGWRGPYLRLRNLSEGIRDGWAKEIVSLPQGLTPSEATLWPVGLLTPYSSGISLAQVGGDYELITAANVPIYGAFFRVGFDAGQSVGLNSSEFYRDVITDSDFIVPAAFTVNVSTNFPALGAVGGATHRLIVAMYGPNPEMSASTPPVRVTLRIVNYHDTNVFTINNSMMGFGATIGPKVFRAMLYRGGTTLIKGSPVYANLSSANDLVRLSIP
jgi:prepilin-type N-terminal cleavage/methylation domain-containing protein